MNNLDTISPLDNRYKDIVASQANNFSEYALIKTRFDIEIEWVIFLLTNFNNKFGKISKTSINKILDFKNSFDRNSALTIKKIEKTTNHDVKAVEYFIRNKFIEDKVLSKYIHLIHFGLTSEDINSLSYAVMIRNGIQTHLHELKNTLKILKNYSKKWSDISFLARTHGQAASPSTIGKELKVFLSRLELEIEILKSIKPMAKFSGATGNYHTFNIVDNTINWQIKNKKFINSFKIIQSPITTQIEPHDWIAQTNHSINRINNIYIDLAQDMWIYISNDIFKLKLNKNEVGSSTMPHKVNPIDFENSEGNFSISNSLNDFFANKLSKSRLQRDLSDSTVLRNIGLGFGYALLGLKSIEKGLNKITPNLDAINKELSNNWEVLTEAIQTIMRYEGIPDAYEQLKSLSRGNKLSEKTYKEFVMSLEISEESKDKLSKLTPHTYTGIASNLAK